MNSVWGSNALPPSEGSDPLTSRPSRFLECYPSLPQRILLVGFSPFLHSVVSHHQHSQNVVRGSVFQGKMYPQMRSKKVSRSVDVHLQIKFTPPRPCLQSAGVCNSGCSAHSCPCCTKCICTQSQDLPRGLPALPSRCPSLAYLLEPI